jgi:hypothetical protein
MNFRTAAVAAALAAALGTSATFAQPGPPPSQQGAPLQPGDYGQKNPIKAQRAQIKQDVRSGRISKSEGKQLKQQLKAARAERRAQKQARRAQRGYQPANYSPPPQPQ